MNDVEVQRLLNLADARPPALTGGLAGRVRDRERRGRRVRSGAVVAGVLAVAVGVASMRWRGGGAADAPVSSAAQEKAELAALSREVEGRRRVIEGMLSGERLKVLERRLREAEARAAAEGRAVADRERGAGALMVYAGELRRHGAGAGAAGREYRRVIELFSDSPLAAAAKANLATIER